MAISKCYHGDTKGEWLKVLKPQETLVRKHQVLALASNQEIDKPLDIDI